MDSAITVEIWFTSWINNHSKVNDSSPDSAPGCAAGLFASWFTPSTDTVGAAFLGGKFGNCKPVSACIGRPVLAVVVPLVFGADSGSAI